ncbi:MAG TPA: hypothetical protein VM370_00315 [Candidatus Thermoplasmatota archaeon]|nr:hypothetical protein [Candidatus Thermoplasmatota archaeon]
MDAFEDDAPTRRDPSQGEWLALGALLVPWFVLSLLLPIAHMVAALAMLCALAALLACAVRWSRTRAGALGLDAEAWGLAAVLSLGFSQALLLGADGKTGFEKFCLQCGGTSDARAPFCYGCGSYT